MTHKKLIALDFDGVLHSYTTPWSNAETISDGPTDGAMEFLYTISGDSRFDVIVCSSRCREDTGIQAIERWLVRQMGEAFGDEGRRIAFDIPVVAEKPPAFIFLDDRAVTFMGTWPSLDRLAAFQPYYRKPAHLRPDPETAMAVADSLLMQISQIAKDAGCPDGDQPLEFIRERMQAKTELKAEAAALIAEVDAGRIPVESNKPSVSDLAGDAIKYWLFGGEQPLAIERLPRVGGDGVFFEWKVPFRGAYVFMPELAFAGCSTEAEARLVSESYLDAFADGKTHELAKAAG